MGSLIQTFTFDRNTFRKTNEESADSVVDHIGKVRRGDILDKTASNIVGALASYMGVFRRHDGTYEPTDLANVFLTLYAVNKADSWRWLVARSLWRFVVPNGTNCKVNVPSQNQATIFAFFHLLVQLLTHLSAHPEKERYLYFEEICKILVEDDNWKLSGKEIYDLLLNARSAGTSGFDSDRSFLADLENSLSASSEFNIPRDNFNGLFLKAFAQTGFFQFLNAANGKAVALALEPDLDAVLQRRLRFILDHPPRWDGADWATYLDIQAEDLPKEVTREQVVNPPLNPTGREELEQLLAVALEHLSSSKIVVRRGHLLRLISSLISKRFLILTGLSGSGKTRLAQTFARWLSQDGCYVVVPVGADWTSSDNILGYPDGLQGGNYVAKPALDLILHAQSFELVPHFLILDEMNLSHVERYFADVLSIIESDEGLELYSGDMEKSETWRKTSAAKSVPPRLKQLPANLFIIGTVNVDETTYMFSPKVLDRANVIEFRMDAAELESFLNNPIKPDLSKLDGKGALFGESFVDAANNQVAVTADVKAAYDAEIMLFFKTLQAHGAEFGYRTAYETARFIHFYKLLGNHADGETAWFSGAFDCVVFQKLLPKLHGSRTKLGPVLKKLWFLCVNDAAARGEDALKTAEEAARSTDKKAEPSVIVPPGAPYPLSAEKIGRMWRLLIENGFASFAEA